MTRGRPCLPGRPSRRAAVFQPSQAERARVSGWAVGSARRHGAAGSGTHTTPPCPPGDRRRRHTPAHTQIRRIRSCCVCQRASRQHTRRGGSRPPRPAMWRHRKSNNSPAEQSPSASGVTDAFIFVQYAHVIKLESGSGVRSAHTVG